MGARKPDSRQRTPPAMPRRRQRSQPASTRHTPSCRRPSTESLRNGKPIPARWQHRECRSSRLKTPRPIGWRFKSTRRGPRSSRWGGQSPSDWTTRPPAATSGSRVVSPKSHASIPFLTAPRQDRSAVGNGVTLGPVRTRPVRRANATDPLGAHGGPDHPRSAHLRVPRGHGGPGSPSADLRWRVRPRSR